jgi:hypothetical protein
LHRQKIECLGEFSFLHSRATHDFAILYFLLILKTRPYLDILKSGTLQYIDGLGGLNRSHFENVQVSHYPS